MLRGLHTVSEIFERRKTMQGDGIASQRFPIRSYNRGNVITRYRKHSVNIYPVLSRNNDNQQVDNYLEYN